MIDSRMHNKYCALSSLQNESDVEQFLVVHLLSDLGYGSDYVQTKATIKKTVIGKGKRRKSYVPDYLAYLTRDKDKPVLVIDAKHPNESVEDGVDDAQLYASIIRRHMLAPKPDQYCVGVNGHCLMVKHYDSDIPIHELSFLDFIDGNPAFEALRQHLGRERLAAKTIAKKPINDFEYRAVSPVELPAIFEACHRTIWKAEKRGPASAFFEFAKLMFVKIDEDRRLRELLVQHKIDIASGSIPSDVVRFSVAWMEQMEQNTDNPINTILFAQLAENLETQVAKGQKKRIFEPGEGINLAPSTIKEAVAFLEHFDLYAVDEDLNGRLFETFLTATMRGKDLGQFFTPRSVVKFMVKLAKLTFSLRKKDTVLDGCCGTGGFLIEAMAEMSAGIKANRALTRMEKDAFHKELRTERLWGIDAGKDPMMARIARLNMLLHKDGGSRIYYADALDKQLRVEAGLPVQTRLDIEELRAALVTGHTRMSAVLTNPPFSMTYGKKKPNERAVLSDYKLAIDGKGKTRTSLRSSVMFLERYWDLLDSRGRLITVMDESVLNTLTRQPFREYILQHFILKAVISLPRNTFVKAQGSVKTSVLYLRKKSDLTEPQPDIFMAICHNVGHSDSGKERPHLNELPRLLGEFNFFEEHGRLSVQLSGTKDFTVSDVTSDNPTIRLDAHWFDPRYFKTMQRLREVAESRKWGIVPLRSLFRDKTDLTGGETPRGAAYPDEGPKFIRVQNVQPNSLVWNSDRDPCIDSRTHTTRLKRSQLKAGNVVLTITGTYGIAAVVPPDFGEANINQHCVRIDVGDAVLPEYLCVFLNSKLCRPQFERAVTGSSRPALDYGAIREIEVLLPPDEKEQRRVADQALDQLKRATSLREEADALCKSVSELL